MPSSILWIDSGTMIAASKSLGIPNPPGFPLYMLVSHIFTLIPYVSALTALQLFSIAFSLGLLILVYKIILLLINYLENTYSGEENRLLPYLSAFFATLALAFSYQFWSQSQNTEGFIFTYFLVAWLFYILLKLFLGDKREQFQREDFRKREKTVFRCFLLLSFAYGIGTGANPTIAVLAPTILYALYLYRRFLDIRKLVIFGFIFILMFLAIYSYLPIRASSYPFVNWGNPQTLSLFIGHLHGAGLNIYEPESNTINGFTGSPVVFAQSVSYFFLQFLLQFTPFLVPFIIIGIYFVAKKNSRLLWLLLLVPITDVFYAGLYYSGNQESWFIPAWVFLAIFMGIGFHCLTSRLSNKRYLILVFSLCLLPLFTWFYFLNRSSHKFSSDYIENLYDHLEKNAILLGSGDFFNSLSNYVKVGDRYRDDVIPVTVNVFYVNRWQRDNLRNSTDIVVSDEIENIIRYKSFSEYNEAMNKFIADNIDKRPIYVTPLSLRSSALAATDAGQLRLDSRFKLVPNGLSLKIVYATESATPNLSAFDFNFDSPLTKPPIYLERNYKGAFRNILSDYAYSFEALGDWYDQNAGGNSLLFYKKALSIQQDNPEVLGRLGEYYAKREDFNASYQYLTRASLLSPRSIGIRFNLGLSLFNLGKFDQARQEFEAVKILASIGDPIANDAQNLINLIEAKKSSEASFGMVDEEFAQKISSWREIKDEENNFYLKLPSEFLQIKSASSSSSFFVEKTEAETALNIAVFGQKLDGSDDIEKLILTSGLEMTGVKLDTQSYDLPGFKTVIQVFGSQKGDSELRFILRRGNYLWQIKVYPGNSPKLEVFYDILKTFRPKEEL